MAIIRLTWKTRWLGEQALLENSDALVNVAQILMDVKDALCDDSYLISCDAAFGPTNPKAKCFQGNSRHACNISVSARLV